MKNGSKIEKAFLTAKEKYADGGVNVETALKIMSQVSLSLHCWQGDDVGGFESGGGELSGGGLQVTGGHPGRARSLDELRQDLDCVYHLLPGSHRLNLHAIYGDFGKKKVDRDEIEIKHFQSWLDWSKPRGVKLDFNATCFSHPLAADGFTLSNRDQQVRGFWIEHVKRCRRIASEMGKQQKSPCLHNLWIPDGFKDTPADRLTPRKHLKESLDKIYSEKFPSAVLKDAVESKLFGIGSESCVVGSHEFYLAYALSKGIMICLDLGHFHPTESVADKISSVLLYSDELLLHLSRGVRWDSDHVVVLNDEMRAVADEVVKCRVLNRVNLALDFFDASLNRIGAWVIGARTVQKAILGALLTPWEKLQALETKGAKFEYLARVEECKLLPLGDVWNYFCLTNDVPPSDEWIDVVNAYERKVLSKRK